VDSFVSETGLYHHTSLAEQGINANEYITIRIVFLSLILCMNFKRQVMRDQQLSDGAKTLSSL